MTPLLDALLARAARDTLRLHMPGHAGRSILAGWEHVFAADFTELSDTGNLYAGGDDGPIRAAERLYADCYGAADCLFLTGGATQGVMAMLSAFARPGDTVILDRNCHFSVHNALALLDLRPVWVQAPLLHPFAVTAGLLADALLGALDRRPRAACVLVTSPSYYGVLSDLAALANCCRTRGVPLLVDAAHGAHLPFLDGRIESGAARPAVFSSPVAQGAAAAVLSAHKTLPALGQSAFLLAGPDTRTATLRRCAALFGSSSPSYVLMASLDAARAYMETDGRDALLAAAQAAEEIRQSAPCFLGYSGRTQSAPTTGLGGDIGRTLNGGAGRLIIAPTEPVDRSQPKDGEDAVPYCPELSTVNCQLSTDPLRLCVYTGAGHATAARLESEHNIACEMADTNNIVLLLSPLHTPGDLIRLKAALKSVLPPPPDCQLSTVNCQLPLPPVHCTPREALFSPRAALHWRAALGRVAAEPVSLYPPGAPLLARGERVDEGVTRRLEEAGFKGEIVVTYSA